MNIFGNIINFVAPKKIKIDKKVNTRLSPFDIYRKLHENFENSFLLESREGKRKLARFSFIGFEPSHILKARGKVLIINGKKTVCEDPLSELRALISKNFESRAGFLGGAVGYISYDYVRNIENIPNTTKDEFNFPDFEFGVFQDCLVYDHGKKELRYLSCDKNRFPLIKKIIHKENTNHILHIGKIKTNMSKEKFERIVSKAKEYIKSGDIFQVVLSRRYEFSFKGKLIEFYKNLRKINPSPYMYYIKFGERQIIGTSPENLVRIEGNRIDSYATIAGTRPRGKTKAEDKKLEKELLSDKKERAEHLMLVDLTRNDIGKVVSFGSVKVPEFMQVYKFSHVQHIVSRVIGKLNNHDCFDVFKSIFPAGTVSGAPKIRAMEIIEELESLKRGPYAGAIGYFSFNGNADFAITIRSLFANGSKAFIQVGSGIVYDSIPEEEFFETENKAKALLHALNSG